MTVRASRMLLVHLAAIGALLLAGILPAAAADCRKCHDSAGFKGEVVHAPVRKDDCSLCHAPHVSKYKGLLRQGQQELCFSCHDKLAGWIGQSEFAHQPVQKGECTACHAPHASGNKALLRYDMPGACYDCHKESGQKPAYVHQPFAQGRCAACHDPHASSDPRLLKKAGAGLCLGCHAASASLAGKHLGRELKGMDCLSCHNPHGSATPSLVRNVQHRPFAEKRCNACHGQKAGVAVCLGCHEGVLPTFNGTHSHLFGDGRDNTCVRCHNPHVGDRAGLFAENMGTVCRSCHADTFERRKQTLYKHPGWNVCTDCHALHGSNQVAMLRDEPIKVCSRCHEEHSSFTHPIGKDALDPRSGQPMSCDTCHDPNLGTMFKYFLRGDAEGGLCVKCHKGY